MDEFTYDDLVDGLRAVIARVQRTELRGATIQIVGGAALRLAYFERAATVDVDARIVPADEIESIADQLADERGWSSGWLNHNASQFVPAWGRSIEWVTLFADDSVTVEVAPVDALLAMKLLAAAGRPGRDTADILQLLRLNNVQSVEGAEMIFEAFYPGDSLSDRVHQLVERAFTIGLPPLKPTPPRPNLQPEY